MSVDDGHEISVNDLLLYAVVLSLEKHPKFNAVFTDGEHRLIEEVNIGYAVDSENGLVVPVLKHAGKYALTDIAAQRRQIVDRVLQGNHEPADLQDGTFTISNVGVLGMDSALSLINPPQVVILAVGRRRPMLFESGNEVTTATGVELSLIIDHRVLDGGDAGRFLQTLSSYIEQPARMLRDASR
jgi:pyruvate dehydrogenase E2 component (dihydrolipoamide acetyltransferase)